MFYSMMRVLLDGDGGGGGGAYGSFVATICDNVTGFVKAFGSYIILGAGIALICAGIVQITKILISGRAAGFMIPVICLLTGGLLAFGGWSMLTDGDVLGGTGKNTMDKLMEGITPTAIGEFDGGSGGGGTDAKENARSGLGALSESFIYPFGKMMAVSVRAILVVLAVVQIAKYLFMGGRASVSWLKVAAMCLLGSVLFAATPDDDTGGWTWIRDIAVGSTKDAVINISDGNSSDEASNLDNPGFTGADPSDVPG